MPASSALEPPAPRGAMSHLAAIKNVLWLSFPNSLNSIMNGSVGFLCTLFTGLFLTPAEIAGIGIGFSVFNICAASNFVGIGLGFMPDLAAARGSEDPARFAAVLWRSLVIFIALSVVFTIILFNVHHALAVFQQPPLVLAHATDFIRVRAPLVIVWALSIIVMRLGNVLFLSKALAFGAIAPVTTFVLVLPLALWMGYGVTGVAMVLNVFDIVRFVSLAVLAAPVAYRRYGEYLRPPVITEIFNVGGLCRILINGAAASVTLFVEWWSGEIGLLLCGTMGVAEAAAGTAVYSMVICTFMLPLGVGYTAAAMVGQRLGQRSPDAKYTALVCIGCAVVLSSIVSAVIFSTRGSWPTLFSGIEAEGSVNETMLEPLPLLANGEGGLPVPSSRVPSSKAASVPHAGPPTAASAFPTAAAVSGRSEVVLLPVRPLHPPHAPPFSLSAQPVRADAPSSRVLPPLAGSVRSLRALRRPQSDEDGFTEGALVMPTHDPSPLSTPPSSLSPSITARPSAPHTPPNSPRSVPGRLPTAEASPLRFSSYDRPCDPYTHQEPPLPSGHADPKAAERLIRNAAPVLCAYIVVDGAKAVCSAVARAAKKFRLAAIVTVSSYIFGAGLGVFLAFDHPFAVLGGWCNVQGGGMGVSGLWAGLFVATLLVDISFMIWIFVTDWDALANRVAKVRKGAAGGVSPTSSASPTPTAMRSLPFENDYDEDGRPLASGAGCEDEGGDYTEAAARYKSASGWIRRDGECDGSPCCDEKEGRMPTMSPSASPVAPRALPQLAPIFDPHAERERRGSGSSATPHHHPHSAQSSARDVPAVVDLQGRERRS